jgi:hypothetical protein
MNLPLISAQKHKGYFDCKTIDKNLFSLLQAEYNLGQHLKRQLELLHLSYLPTQQQFQKYPPPYNNIPSQVNLKIFYNIKRLI